MNVQELIDELMKIEDKSKVVKLYDVWTRQWETDFEINDCDNVIFLES